MDIKLKKISSLEKVRGFEDNYSSAPDSIKLLGGEHYAYQLVVASEYNITLKVTVNSDIKEYVTTYVVADVFADRVTHNWEIDDGFIIKEPGIMPDLLKPLENQGNNLLLSNKIAGSSSILFKTIWVDVNIPEDMVKGTHNISITFDAQTVYGEPLKYSLTDNTEIEILPVNLPENEIQCTQWFYNDCIASAHNVEVYSEKHWSLIEKYVKLAVNLGLNTILTPVITPPLDTEPGFYRQNVQLVKINEDNGKYIFNFELLDRFIDICKSNGIKNFEICHLYSQWGLKCAPPVYVNDKLKFGWHIAGNSAEYTNFLRQFLPALVNHLKEKEIDKSNCIFHISDEPNKNAIENYKNAYNIIRPLIGDIKILDAISNLEFYKMGLMDIPVCASDHIEPFLDADIENLWTYYCCCQVDGVSNRFIAMPSTRNRAIGLHLYKYNIKGFLQWGYNFYNARRSLYPINPLLSTSADGGFPSGDSFSVYPYGDDVYPSLRAIIFKDALQDVRLMKLAESIVGKDKIIELMESIANCEITFKICPTDIKFYDEFTKKLKEFIEKTCN